MVHALTPRENWRLARVTEILSSDPGRPRRFMVRDSAGALFDRHARQLVPLELDADSEPPEDDAPPSADEN